LYQGGGFSNQTSRSSVQPFLYHVFVSFFFFGIWVFTEFCPPHHPVTMKLTFPSYLPHRFNYHDDPTWTVFLWGTKLDF
jgi:hypothetical protein